MTRRFFLGVLGLGFFSTNFSTIFSTIVWKIHRGASDRAGRRAMFWEPVEGEPYGVGSRLKRRGKSDAAS